jgi:hypothetical protein
LATGSWKKKSEVGRPKSEAKSVKRRGKTKVTQLRGSVLFLNNSRHETCAGAVNLVTKDFEIGAKQYVYLNSISPSQF